MIFHTLRNTLHPLTQPSAWLALLKTKWVAPSKSISLLQLGTWLAMLLVLPVTQAHSAPTSTVQLKNGHVDYYKLADPLSDNYSYQVYVPKAYDGSKPWPLMVALHGCGTTADQFMYSSLMNDVADKGRFLVVYMDNRGQCWRAAFSEPASVLRGGKGDADRVANMTRQTMSMYRVDPEQVYLLGMSSGGYQTTATIAAYPEIYAAAGVHSGGPYMGSLCVALPDVVAPVNAAKAVLAMGARKRIIPFISFGGTSDVLGESGVIGGCARTAFYAAMNQNNTVSALNNGQFWALWTLISNPDGQLISGIYAQDQSSTQTGLVPNGHAWIKKVWRDQSRCVIGEQWIIHGMGHFWSGGSTDPEYAGPRPRTGGGFNDPRGPHASQAAWEFFSRYRKSDTGNACAESRLPG